MFDGAALGTLIIGLNSVRMDAEWSEAPARRPAQPTRRPILSALRVRMAVALRFAADRLDRAPARAIHDRGLGGTTAGR